MNDNLINLLKIFLIYPIGFITLFLLSNYKDKLPNIEFIKYSNTSNFNKNAKRILTYRKLKISESTEIIVCTLVIILLNFYLILKFFMDDLIKNSSNPLICEISSEYQKELKQTDVNDIDTTIKNLTEECNESNLNFYTKYGRCSNCSSKKDYNNKYKCQFRNKDTQAITEFKSDNQCKVYKDETEMSSKKETSVYLIRNFFVLFLCCLCVNLLMHLKVTGNGIFKKYIISSIIITIYLIIILLIAIYNIGKKDYEKANVMYSIFGIILMLIFQFFIKFLLCNSS